MHDCPLVLAVLAVSLTRPFPPTAFPSLSFRYNLNDETGELEAAEDWEPQPGPEMAQPGSWVHRWVRENAQEPC